MGGGYRLNSAPPPSCGRIATDRMMTAQRTAGALLCALLITGCADTGCADYDELEHAMRAFKDRPVEELSAVLGPPSAQQDISGQKTLVWTRRADAAQPHENTASRTTTPATSIRDCTLFVLMDENRIIRGWDSTGATKDCASYADKLH